MAAETRLTNIEKCRLCDSYSGVRFVQVAGHYGLECKECSNYGQLANTKHEAVLLWNKQQGKVEEVKHDIH
jgi:hypothetical protein